MHLSTLDCVETLLKGLDSSTALSLCMLLLCAVEYPYIRHLAIDPVAIFKDRHERALVMMEKNKKELAIAAEVDPYDRHYKYWTSCHVRRTLFTHKQQLAMCMDIDEAMRALHADILTDKAGIFTEAGTLREYGNPYTDPYLECKDAAREPGAPMHMVIGLSDALPHAMRTGSSVRANTVPLLPWPPTHTSCYMERNKPTFAWQPLMSSLFPPFQ
jgi:hypothetical protein